jgi:peptidoglycan/xylan/chitin deacetylase (PgdA/CDA1 family)
MNSQDRLLTSNFISKVRCNPNVVIGGHTHNHFNLAELTLTDKEWQIKKNKDLLEYYLENKINHFAFPFGGRRFVDIESINFLSKCGFRTATTTISGKINPSCKPFYLPRIGVRDDSNLEQLLQ